MGGKKHTDSKCMNNAQAGRGITKKNGARKDTKPVLSLSTGRQKFSMCFLKDDIQRIVPGLEWNELY